MDDVSLTKECRDCGRVGTRSFTRHALRSTPTEPYWVCSSITACHDRKYETWMGRR